MKITTQGNGIRIGNRLEEKIAAKMSKFNKFSGDDGTLNVRIRRYRDGGRRFFL